MKDLFGVQILNRFEYLVDYLGGFFFLKRAFTVQIQMQIFLGGALLFI